jgi:hypothetical protein
LVHNRKSVVRSFRLPTEVCEALEEEAQVQDTTVNALVDSVLTKYAQYDRFMIRLEYVMLSKKLFVMLLECPNEDSLREIVYEFGRTNLHENVGGRAHPYALKDILGYFALGIKYSGAGKVYVYEDGGRYTVVLRHSLGEKVSRAAGWLFKGFIDSYYKDADFDYAYSDDQLTVTLTEPHVRVKDMANFNDGDSDHTKNQSKHNKGG